MNNNRQSYGVAIFPFTRLAVLLILLLLLVWSPTMGRIASGEVAAANNVTKITTVDGSTLLPNLFSGVPVAPDVERPHVEGTKAEPCYRYYQPEPHSACLPEEPCSPEWVWLCAYTGGEFDGCKPFYPQWCWPCPVDLSCSPD